MLSYDEGYHRMGDRQWPYIAQIIRRQTYLIWTKRRVPPQARSGEVGDHSAGSPMPATGMPARVSRDEIART